MILLILLNIIIIKSAMALFHELTQERQYLLIADKIIKFGDYTENRTGVNTYSLFGSQMRFSLKHGIIPILTSKQVAYNTIIKELLWFISGSTDNNKLKKEKVRIWNANSTREFLDERGLTNNREGDLGPIYGFQWRHFGAKYKGADADYTGKGVDQLANVINQIKEDPTSRRIIMSAWNPVDLNKMALPPCHILVQFRVTKDGLSSHLYQRSADFALGVPFNIASYALLTHMIAHVCGLEPNEFVYSMGDVHIYENHLEGMKQQLMRSIFDPPKLVINRKVTSIDDFKKEDFNIVDYNYHPKINFPMAV